MTFSTAGQRKTGLAALSLAALVIVSGCQSARIGTVNTQPAPLTPAPSGQVVASQLPPPSGPTDANAFPPPPTTGETTDVAALDPAAGTAEAGAPAGAPDLTAGSVAGVWNATVSGQSCRVATPQTKFGQGFRAGPLRCPVPLDGVKSWNVAGKQLALYDGNGNLLARLYSSSGERFDGQMTSGQPISLSR
jgi:hypothetical protein